MKIAVIVGSTRPGRVSDRLAKWVATNLATVKSNQVTTLDLADYALPFLDEPISPQYNPDRKPNAVAQKWLAALADADAYVIVTPEYNRSFSAVLKNALDYVDFQLAKKPVAIVGHGSTGGAQAVGQLRGVIPGLHAVTTPNAVYFSFRAGEVLDEQGNLNETISAMPNGPTAALAKLVEEVTWYGEALLTARAKS